MPHNARTPSHFRPRGASNRLAGANLDHTKRYNRRVVLEIARLRGPLSRADLTRVTGLAAQTISNITEELCAAGLLRGVPRRPGKRGEPTVVFEINPEGGYTFGVSLDDNRLVVLLADIAGSVVHREEMRIEPAPPETVLKLVERAVKQMLARFGIARSRVWGAGLVIPGPHPGWRAGGARPLLVEILGGYPLARELQNRLAMPARIENDATAAAIGEWLYGAGKALTDFVYLHFGVGVGAGLFIRGHPYRGGFGKSGEIGHMIVEANGRPCACGNRGCLERYVSLSAAQAALTGKPEGDTPVDPARLNKAFLAGEPSLVTWVDEAARKLKQAIVGARKSARSADDHRGRQVPRPMLEAIDRADDAAAAKRELGSSAPDRSRRVSPGWTSILRRSARPRCRSSTASRRSSRSYSSRTRRVDSHGPAALDASWAQPDIGHSILDLNARRVETCQLGTAELEVEHEYAAHRPWRR